MTKRELPNIIITGTPGVGKTSHCEMLAENTKLTHLSVNDVAKTKDCYEGWDAKLESFIVDEDKLLDAVNDDLEQGGQIIDWHACDLFPESQIDLVVVLHASTESLYDRLHARGYPEAKLQENLDSEIMDVLSEEAREAFNPQIIVELQSNTAEDIDSNVERIESWIEQWQSDNRGSSS